MSDPRHWTPEQLFVLHWLYPDFTAEEVAGVLRHTMGDD
jgi:hypothetical protein